MPIDPNIPLQIKPLQVESPANQLAMMGNVMKLGEMQRGVETQNKLRELYSQGVDVSTPEGFKQLASVDPAVAMKLRTDALQGQKIQGDIKKINAEISLKDMEIAREGYKNLDFNPSDNNFKSFLEDAVLSGKMTPTQAQQQFAQIAPLDIAQRKEFIKNRALKAEQLFSDITQRRGQDISATTTMRGQNISAETAQRGQDMGRIPVGFRMTADGTLEPIPGGPTTTNLSPKEIQLREAKFPQATQAVNTFEAKTTQLEKDLIALRNHPGLSSITGIAAGRAPGITSQGRAAEALYDKITARGGFKELQDMRAASPTGGALGNISNQEGTQLRAAFAAIDRKQDAADVQKAIDIALGDLQASKGRIREAYDMTYEYKGMPASGGGGGAPTPPPAPSAGANSVTIPGGKVLTFPTPEAAAAYRQAAGL
jgi:hypothetical protein